MSTTANGRDALAKAIMAEDFIGKIVPLVEMAEDLESLQDLHRLCNIMKTVILLNDTSIIEHAVSDECVLGVVVTRLIIDTGWVIKVDIKKLSL
ncbi:hypothetical protein LB505_000949 [Fusarium chuoi]|nr:hypothetical protein LB505_000949 [Fusarium chuoi]